LTWPSGVGAQGIAQDLDADFGLDGLDGVVGKVGNAAVAAIDTISAITCTGAADHRLHHLNILSTAFARLGDDERHNNTAARGRHHFWHRQAECTVEEIIDPDCRRVAHPYSRWVFRIDQ
jgi:hypothetical protein